MYLTDFYCILLWFHSQSHSVFSDPEADQEASEMLTDNAQNLISVVSEVLYATEVATIHVPPNVRKEFGLQWVKRA